MKLPSGHDPRGVGQITGTHEKSSGRAAPVPVMPGRMVGPSSYKAVIAGFAEKLTPKATAGKTATPAIAVTEVSR